MAEKRCPVLQWKEKEEEENIFKRQISQLNPRLGYEI